MLRIAHSERYPIPLPPDHRFPIQKYELVRRQLEYEGLISQAQLLSPEWISDEIIQLTHCAQFWKRAKLLQLTEKEVRKIGFPLCEELIHRSISSASGTLRAAEWALEDGAGMNLAGGTHHAFFDRGEGFCLLNDIAIAVNFLLDSGKIRKALIVDLDVHQGNGTAALFRNDPRVFTFSMHCEGNYPFRKEESDLDVGIAPGTSGEEYLALLRNIIPRLYEEFQPDIVFYQAGVDVLETDRLGKINLSMRDCYERDYWVISQSKVYQIPLVVVMGGGYSENLNTIVKAHSNTYRLTLEVYEKTQHFIEN